MKNKGKKRYLTFMALFLSITMMISSSITLAFFGSTGSGTQTIKMGNAVEVGSTIEVQSNTLYVSPSQNLDVDASALVKSPGDGVTTDAILRAKITSSTGLTNVTLIPKITIDGDNAYWVKNDDGYFYLVTQSGGDTLYTIKTTTTGKTVPMTISIIVPSELSNADAGTPYQINVVFCAVQARIYDSTGMNTITNTIDNVREVFETVEEQ